MIGTECHFNAGGQAALSTIQSAQVPPAEWLVYSFLSRFIAITKVAALAYLMFNLYTPPCFAAIGAMNSEMKSAKWLWGGIGLQLGTGYTVGFLVYQIGTLITTGSIGAGFVPGLIAVIVFAAVLVWLCLKADKDLKQEYALNGARA